MDSPGGWGPKEAAAAAAAKRAMTSATETTLITNKTGAPQRAEPVPKLPRVTVTPGHSDDAASEVEDKRGGGTEPQGGGELLQ